MDKHLRIIGPSIICLLFLTQCNSPPPVVPQAPPGTHTGQVNPPVDPAGARQIVNTNAAPPAILGTNAKTSSPDYGLSDFAGFWVQKKPLVWKESSRDASSDRRQAAKALLELKVEAHQLTASITCSQDNSQQSFFAQDKANLTVLEQNKGFRLLETLTASAGNANQPCFFEVPAGDLMFTLVGRNLAKVEVKRKTAGFNSTLASRHKLGNEFDVEVFSLGLFELTPR